MEQTAGSLIRIEGLFGDESKMEADAFLELAITKHVSFYFYLTFI